MFLAHLLKCSIKIDTYNFALCQKREIAEIRAQVRRDIRDLKPKGGTKHIMDAEQDCFRGLEAYRSKERETKVRNFVRTIVDEHMTRRSMGLWDEIGIAMLSVTYSKQDRNLAHSTATSDAAEICTAGSKGNNEDVLKRGFSRQSSSAPSIVVYESELRRKFNLKIYERVGLPSVVPASC